MRAVKLLGAASVAAYLLGLAAYLSVDRALRRLSWPSGR